MASLELRNLVKIYGRTHAVDGISLTVADGEFLAILGPSGCGKSTTMRMIAGLEHPTQGDILIDGEVVTPLPPRMRNVSMVFQSYALYPHMSVAENIAFPLKARRIPRSDREQKIRWAAGTIGIEHLLARRPARLSGGEKQRVALARALVRDPTLFIFDEPLSALDAQVRAMARSELRQLHDRTGITTVYVTHDQFEAMGMGDRIAIMKDGRVRQIGTPQQMYAHPADTFVASFLGTPPMNLLTQDDHIVGFRPEHVLLAGEAAASGHFHVPARIIRQEFLGAIWQIYAETELRGHTNKLLAQFTSAEVQTLHDGDAVQFMVSPEHLRYFDPGSGKKMDAPHV
ncbi:MAG: ABC transporter ATP-binding protein [Ottowia sp.]|nr:ABC transporter ATP-binding protein [Ottowia sp.]